MRSGKPPNDFYERIRLRLRRRVGSALRPAYRVLDLGCGCCELDRYLVTCYGQRVTGVDISGGKLPRHDNPRTRQGRLKCIKADAARLRFMRDGRMDAVVSLWALHEMKDAQRVLREAHRVLRPGGKILMVDFPRGSLAERLWNERYYTTAQVQGMLRAAGFCEVSAKTTARGQVIWATGFCPARCEVREDQGGE